jgi:hypothetical protein
MQKGSGHPIEFISPPNHRGGARYWRPGLSSVGVRFAVLLVTSVVISGGAGLRAMAQSQESVGVVEGTVIDDSGEVVSGAAVSVRNLVTAFMRGTTTDENGHFRFDNVPWGSYLLTLSAGGFRLVWQYIEISSDNPLSLKMAVVPLGVPANQDIGPAPDTPDGVPENPLARMHKSFPTAQLIRPSLPPSHFNFESNRWERDEGEHLQAEAGLHEDPLGAKLLSALRAEQPKRARHKRSRHKRRRHRIHHKRKTARATPRPSLEVNSNALVHGLSDHDFPLPAPLEAPLRRQAGDLRYLVVK